ncbi:hypothetical protein ACWCXB_27955 [Streptomyces sp. NPDC001514]
MISKSAGSARTGAKASTAAAKKSGGPSLTDLVLDLLTKSGEPRSVREIETELAVADPQRSITKTQVVRNSLEALFAKGKAERSKQGSSVYYTARENDAASEAVGEVVAPEAAEEKVAAEV